MKKALTAVLMAFTAILGFAEEPGTGLNIDVSLPYIEFLSGEDVPMTVSINNPGASAFTIDDYAPYDQNAFGLYIRNENGRLLFPRNDKSPLPSCTVKPGETYTFKVNLKQFFDFEAEGHYQVAATLKRGKTTDSSRIMPFTVVGGIEIGKVSRIKEGSDNTSLEYTLLYWPRNDKEHLFVRIVDKPSDRVFGFVQLGYIVRITQPKIEFEPGNIVVITHQTSRDGFVRTKLDLSDSQITVLSRDSLTSAIALQEAAVIRKAQEKIIEMDQEETKKKDEGGFFRYRTTRVKEETTGKKETTENKKFENKTAE